MEKSMARVRRRSFQVNLRSMMYLLIRTVMTDRHIVTIAIQPTRLTIGPLLLDDITGERATTSSIVAMVGRLWWRYFGSHLRVYQPGG
jgi:hypothetical protein